MNMDEMTTEEEDQEIATNLASTIDKQRIYGLGQLAGMLVRLGYVNIGSYLLDGVRNKCDNHDSGE